MTSFAPIRFVLVATSHPGNIGAAARAMKTMGFSDLVLVNPKEHPHPDARARSSGALDVLTSAAVVGSLAEAVADCGLIVGASARRRRLNWPEYDPRALADVVCAHPPAKPVAVVFGPERSGLSNADMDLCNALVYIPANPEYSSLNIAMALQLIAWELRYALAGATAPVESGVPPASGRDMELFYAHLERVLLQTGFLKPDNPRNLMRRLRRLFNRTGLDENEMNIMRGILSAAAPGSGGQDTAADDPIDEPDGAQERAGR